MADHHPTDVEEIWKTIPGYKDYEASNKGAIRSYINNHNPTAISLGIPSILTPTPNRWGYHQVNLRKQGIRRTVYVHKLVALAFFGCRPPGYTVNHKDGIKTNNHIDNLEYATQLENNRHALDIGLANNRGEKHPQALLTDDLVRQIRAELVNYRKGDITRLASKFGVSVPTISHIYRRLTWRHLP